MHRPSSLRPLKALIRTCIALLLAVLFSSVFAETSVNYHPDGIPLAQLPHPGKNGQMIFPVMPEYYLTIYGGSTTGVYFEVASKICELMRKTYAEHHIRCVPLRSNGSGDNMRLMEEGRAQVAIIQSDTNWEAANRAYPSPFPRSVMSLHNEMGLLVVGENSGIKSVSDLRDKRINLGTEGSATRRMLLALLAAHNMDQRSLRKTYSAVTDFNKTGLCLNYIDAYAIWIGHPAKLITDTLQTCGAKVIGISDSATQAMLAKSRFMFKQTLPANIYPGQTTPLESYGLKATLIAAAQAHPYVIYWMTRILHENSVTLRGMHPALFSLKAEELRDQGNFLPFQDGAACYWQPSDTVCAWQKDFPAFGNTPTNQADKKARITKPR